jgi:hypothetical protein
MKRAIISLALVAIISLTSACATVPKDRYNTQKGAAVGAGVGAIMGQVIGRNTTSTLLGAGIGTLVGALVGNAADQSHQAAREAAATNKRVVYYDDQGGVVEAIPDPVNNPQTDCRKVTKKVWDHGELVSETVEEICEGKKQTAMY